MSEDRRKPADRNDKGLRTPARRATDARGARPTQRAFRPLRWAWLLLLVALLAPAYDLFLPAGYRPARARRTVVIERGQSLHEIARELQRVGVIRSQVGFLVLARAMHLDRSVKAGQYSFRMGMTVPALLRALDRGMFGLNLVTIPEGLMVSETAALIERKVGIPAAELEALAVDPDLLDSLEIGAPTLEGWLAPDSYEWLPGTSPEVVLRTMVARTRERVQRATAGYDSLPLGMNMHEVLTLASIVESESRAKEERPHIARVYLNRLERGMLLQADPTVGYALGRGPRSRLTFKDLRVASPYNTYRHEGLPPGPICSPGEEAIAGVMNATVGVNDLYFVARGQGRHLFAPTYEQHLANIAYVRGKQAALEARSNPEAASDAEPDSSTAARAARTPQLADAEKTAAGAGGSAANTRAAVSNVLSAPALTPPVLKPQAKRTMPNATGTPSSPRTVTPPVATGARTTPDPNSPLAPLKGTLLIPGGSIKTASTPPPHETVVPSSSPTAGSKSDSAHAAPRPAKPAAAKPAVPDTAHARRSTTVAKPDSARVRAKAAATKVGPSTAGTGDPVAKPAVAKPAAKAPAKPAADSTKG